MKLSSHLLLLAALATAPVFAATAPAPDSDRAKDLLARHGSVSVAAAGPYVAPGTYRIQVAAKLGQPDATLGHDTWLYHRRRLENSAAEGTLIVRFAAGRVVSLTLATPVTVAALRAEHAKTSASQRLANK